MSFYRQGKEIKTHIPSVVTIVKKDTDCGLRLQHLNVAVPISNCIIQYTLLQCCLQMEKWFHLIDLTYGE